MASVVIRNVDDTLHRQLEASARTHRRSIEEEARELLRLALGRLGASSQESVATVARRFFGLEHGVDLDLPDRNSIPERALPDFGDPE